MLIFLIPDIPPRVSELWHPGRYSAPEQPLVNARAPVSCRTGPAPTGGLLQSDIGGSGGQRSRVLSACGQVLHPGEG